MNTWRTVVTAACEPLPASCPINTLHDPHAKTSNHHCLYLVSPQDLDRHDEWIRHEVSVHAAVEHVCRAVIAAAGEQGIAVVEGSAPHCVCVVAQGLVGLGRQIQIVPVGTHTSTAKSILDTSQESPATAGRSVMLSKNHTEQSES